MPVVLREELSKSRKAKHAVRDIALIAWPEKRAIEKPVPAKVEEDKPTYSRGEAKKIVVNLPWGAYAVQVHMVRNFRGHVKGWINVYDYKGRLVFRAVYRKLKLRYSCGDKGLAWIVELVAEKLKLPLKRINLEPDKPIPCENR
ncbi:MAG: hypothetical protein ABWW69_06560 [Pyrodictiaceae archaeon]